jgi:acyl-CoA thioesterase
MTQSSAFSIPVTPVAPGRWTTTAGPEWINPAGRLWGGFVIGLCVRVLEAEPEAVGEALSLTLTFISGLPTGPLDVHTRRLRQGGSIGIWEVEVFPAGSDEVSVHAIVTMTRRPKTTPFAFARMPAADYPANPGRPQKSDNASQFAASAFERRAVKGFPPVVGENSQSLTWMRSRYGPLDRVILAVLTDNAIPRAMYALGPKVMTVTLSFTIYLHATSEEIAEVGDDFILVECEGGVGDAGASDERSRYWRRDGKLLATAEQLAWYRQTATALQV